MPSADSISGCFGVISLYRKSAEHSHEEIFAVCIFEQNHKITKIKTVRKNTSIGQYI